jgi:hypothetical protein
MKRKEVEMKKKFFNDEDSLQEAGIFLEQTPEGWPVEVFSDGMFYVPSWAGGTGAHGEWSGDPDMSDWEEV